MLAILNIRMSKFVLMKKILLLILMLPLFGRGQITFTKDANTNATLEENQDRISDTVWLTRGSGGALYNIQNETSYSPGTSPAYTEWAIGTTTQLSNGEQLTFSNFRDFYTEVRDGVKLHNRPPLNTDLVLKLTNNTTDTSDDAYYDIRFTSWSSGGSGGFSYERATTPLLSIDEISNTIAIYPNPTTAVVHIEGAKDFEIEVFDILGNKVMQLTGNAVDMTHLATATYILKATDISNNTSRVYKVVKK